jgi:predicted acetyltransferase
VELILPRRSYESSYREYLRELGSEERYPFPLDFEYQDFPALLRRLADLAVQGDASGRVPSSTYWLVDGAELVGVSNLRHYLNDRIRYHGGHIGLGIRPSCRGRGLGRMLLGLTIQEARKKGITPLHIHCHKSNIASARTIVGCGGLLDSECEDGESQEVIQRYIVDAA